MYFSWYLKQTGKIGILENVNIWKELRDIWNEISHQCDDDLQEMAEALINLFENIEIFVTKRFES